MRAVAACALVWCVAANANPDGAPPGHTGAFGEPSCHACHFDGPVREPGGPVRLLGLPARITPGRVYELELLVEVDTPAAGFQLSVRDAGGRQAGALSRADGTTRLLENAAIQYLGHADASNRRWRFLWRAPDAPRTVIFAGALNAANDDQSELGDEIYLIRALMDMEQTP